jgi:hypothetical protein
MVDGWFAQTPQPVLLFLAGRKPAFSCVPSMIDSLEV